MEPLPLFPRMRKRSYKPLKSVENHIKPNFWLFKNRAFKGIFCFKIGKVFALVLTNCSVLVRCNFISLIEVTIVIIKSYS